MRMYIECMTFLVCWVCQGKGNAHFLRITATMDDDLTKDLLRLLEEYHNYRAEWRAIGCFLNISPGDLNAIEKDYPRNCGDCFRAVLLQWLRNENRQETELEQAVEKVKLTYAQDHGELQPKVEMTITIHAQDNGELQQKEEKSIKRWLLAPIIIAVIAILLSLFLSTRFPTGTVPGPSKNISYSLFNATIENLKVLYREHRVMEFNVVDNVPFLNVSLRSNDSSVIEFWQLFHDIDTEYKNLQESNSTKGKMRVLITGHPGGGKTTLLRYLANQWGEGNVLDSCQILFFIQLDQLSQSMEKSPQSLKQLLLNSAHEDFKNIAQLMEEIVDKQGAGTCFLLDSYDGWKFNREKDFVHKLFFEGTLHHSLCVLTTRSLPFIESKQSISHNYTLMGFNQTRLDEYLHNLTSDRHTISFIQKSWKDYNTKELCAIPLNMMMLIYIAKYGEIPLIHTRTQLYIAFMNVTTDHYSERHPNWNSYELKQCIQHRESNVHKDELCAAFHNLTYVAYEAVFYNKVPEISKTTRHNIDKLSLVRVVKVKSTSDRVNYIFSHDTFAEFYAAVYLLNLPPKHLLYLFVEGQRDFKTLKTHSVWAFFFGLLGEHNYIRADMSISAILRQFSIFDKTEYFDTTSTCKCPPVEVMQLIPEIGWIGEKLDNLLESTGLIRNYTMCIEAMYTHLGSLKFILSHATVHKLQLIQFPEMMIFDKGKRHSLDYQTIERALKCRLRYGALIYDDKETIKPMSKHSLTHYHVIENYEPFYYADEDNLKCLLKIGVNLHSLRVYLGHMSPLSQQKTLALINDHTPHLQTLRLITEDDLPTTASLNQLRSTIKLELVIEFLYRSNTPLYRRKLSLPPLEKLKNLSRLESLTIIVKTNQARYYSDMDDFCSNIVDQLGSLKSKVIETLEINGCDSERYVMKLSKLLPPTLQHVSLTRGKLTDKDMPILAKSFKEMHNLISLNLHSNRITGTGLRSLVDGLKSLKHFTTLDLSWNPISVISGLETLVKLTRLRDLKLSLCDITAEALEVLSNLNLNSLDLSLNPVLNSVDGLQLLGRFKSLRQLDIRGTKSFHGDILMDVLKNLTHLQILKLCDYDDLEYFQWSTNNTMSSEWSTDLARKVIDLPELQSLWAQCLYPPYWSLSVTHV